LKTVVAKNGRVQLENEKIPQVRDQHLLIRTMYSVISPGTELSMISNSHNRTIPLGYSAVGEVVECGKDTDSFFPGDIVSCYGAPYVRHSEYLLVPKTLCSKVPTGVDPKEAALAGLGAISIHALRVAKLQFGEWIVVAGLGILGQLIGQIAHAAAYKVIPYDISHERASLFTTITGIPSCLSSEEVTKTVLRQTKGLGVDAVLLCAGGKYSSLTGESLNWIRDQGKIVIVGDIEPNFPREQMFAKEASILISRAGGPGRYDPIYEKNAIDYPYGFIRWTEGRNVEEYLRLVSEKRIRVSPYLQDLIKLVYVPEAYTDLKDKKQSVLTKVIEYS
jgi:threonine dehydrogenase-like Zn-dependent dehydrogenase